MMPGIRARSAGRVQNQRSLRPKPSSARSRKILNTGGSEAPRSVYRSVRGPGSFAGSAVHPTAKMGGNSSAIRAGGFRMMRPAGRDSISRVSSLAMAGRQSFRKRVNGRGALSDQSRWRENGEGGVGSRERTSQWEDRQLHAWSGLKDSYGVGIGRDRAAHYRQPALFQFENSCDSHDRKSDRALVQLPYVERGGLHAAAKGDSMKRVQTALPAIGGARGGGFNMLLGRQKADHRDQTAWIPRRW